SACVLCSNGCALDIGVKDGRIVGVRGRAADDVNRGRLGPKGLHGWEANNSPDRLTRPLVKRKGTLKPASWDEAMDLIVQRTRDIRDQYTASAIGFYTSGQLMLEEYYTLSIIGKAGLGTPHMDGNTRLCTATAAAALKETFGSDGQPGGYFDIDETDCLFMVGHNMAATDTVLWSRVLDRRRGPKPPKLIVVDPRRTSSAEEADLHLAPRIGTNVAVLNGLLNLLVANGQIDRAFIDAHTTGFETLKSTVSKYPTERFEEISGIAASDLREAARILGETPTLVSTCLQGVYQSMQATAAAVQVNNINLVRGLIGKAGCAILQMNGQPTAQNNRECGADGDLPGFRNWDNPKHVEELARIWNVDPAIIPHWAPPTHALEMFHHAEKGSIRMLWISATNPAVSLPDLAKVRDILSREDVFVIVQDAFMTETARLADVVLPCAIWAEKTGTFTNVDRTVHISHKAVEPPGEARSDFDIWLDYARRMDFRDKDGAPLVKWTTPEDAFEAWKRCTRGRPCDYTGLSYGKLTGGSGIQWPCNEANPEGTRRLYVDHVFPTDPEVCETYGHDLVTGGEVDPEHYRAQNPQGRAFLKAAHYRSPHETADATYPFMLSTGRLVYHFHTRTKTGRAEALQKAAPEAFIQLAEADATRLGIAEGDLVRATSRRGIAEAPARIGGVLEGEAFLPFHYGYWDEPARTRAANELTLYDWDAVSKQPHFKYAAVKLEKVSSPTSQPALTGSAAEHGIIGTVAGTVSAIAHEAVAFSKRGGPARTHIPDYLGILQASERRLVKAFVQARQNHPDVPDLQDECATFIEWASDGAARLDPFIKRYGERLQGEPERLTEALVRKRVSTGFSLLRELHDLWLLVNESLIAIKALKQASQALRDSEFERVLTEMEHTNSRELNWLEKRLKQAAPQALVVPS
ncbi:MAG: molybdopterin-dependent oxidoreductase, partial [Methylobacteriaceae bacterium]|nr:molybdopterin-dependent oxidoreductase [Methylobacteriaceae bacterium]